MIARARVRGSLRDNSSGNPDSSLQLLKDVLKRFAADQSRGLPVNVYELRNLDEKGLTRICLYLENEDFDFLTGESFWVPGRGNYRDITPSMGGAGTAAYAQAIAGIYRFLGKKPRRVIKTDNEFVRHLFEEDATLANRVIKKQGIIEIIEEDRTIIPKVCSDLGFGFSFICLDTETTKDFCRPRYLLGCTWDPFYGFREWDESQRVALTEECNYFDRIVTYNGEYFDLGKVLGAELSPEAKRVLERKSLDLYKIISNSRARTRGFQNKGELTLANISFATLGMCKWEVFHEPTEGNRGQPVGDEDGLLDHCLRDVELLKELFFYTQHSRAVYYISYDALRNGRVLDRLGIGEEYEKEVRSNGLRE